MTGFLNIGAQIFTSTIFYDSADIQNSAAMNKIEIAYYANLMIVIGVMLLFAFAAALPRQMADVSEAVAQISLPLAILLASTITFVGYFAWNAWVFNDQRSK